MHKFCSCCGTEYTTSSWPRECQCGNIRWLNPIPVVSIIQPVYDARTDMLGVVIAQRAIQPCFGGWSLIGGYMDHTDQSVEDAARREFLEETGIAIPGPVRLAGSRVNTTNNLIIQVESINPIGHDYLLEYGRTCPENSQLSVFWRGEDLSKICFPLNAEFIADYFKRHS